MARRLIIVGLGEALLVEHPDHTEADGLAPRVALDAVCLGHHGLVVSRVGQDAPAGELLTLLGDAGVDVSHVQSDPDLPTGRVTVRPVGGRVARYVDTRAAFDNLQLDFDLEDVAQQADAVVYGMLTRRSGQTRSEENRFIEQCAAALKVFDMTNRGDEKATVFERSQARSGLDLADAAVVDRTALDMVIPGSRDTAIDDVARGLIKEFGLVFMLVVETREPDDDGQQRVTVHTAEASTPGVVPAGRRPLVAAGVSLVHGILRGKEITAAVEFSQRVARHTSENPEAPVPEDWTA